MKTVSQEGRDGLRIWTLGLVFVLFLLAAVLLRLSTIAQEELMLLFGLGVILPLATSVLPARIELKPVTHSALLTVLVLTGAFVLTPVEERGGALWLLLGSVASLVLVLRWGSVRSMGWPAFSLGVSLLFLWVAPLDLPVRQPLLVALSALWCFFGFGLQAVAAHGDAGLRRASGMPLVGALLIWTLGAMLERSAITAVGSALLAFSLWNLCYRALGSERCDLAAELSRRMYLISLLGAGLVCLVGAFSRRPELWPFLWGGFTATCACFGLMSLLFESSDLETESESARQLAQVA